MGRPVLPSNYSRRGKPQTQSRTGSDTQVNRQYLRMLHAVLVGRPVLSSPAADAGCTQLCTARFPLAADDVVALQFRPCHPSQTRSTAVVAAWSAAHALCNASSSPCA